LLDLFTDRPFILENVAPVFAFAESLQNGIDGIQQVEEGGLGPRRIRAFELEFR